MPNKLCLEQKSQQRQRLNALRASASTFGERKGLKIQLRLKFSHVLFNQYLQTQIFRLVKLEHFLPALASE